MRIRLKASVDISSLSAGTQIFAKALQDYGMIFVDSTGDQEITFYCENLFDSNDLQEIDGPHPHGSWSGSPISSGISFPTLGSANYEIVHPVGPGLVLITTSDPRANW